MPRIRSRTKAADNPELPNRPDWIPLTMRCGQCDRDWDEWQPSNCAANVWVAHIKTLRCPYCAAKRRLMIRIGPTPTDAANAANNGNAENAGNGSETLIQHGQQTVAAWDRDHPGCGLPS